MTAMKIDIKDKSVTLYMGIYDRHHMTYIESVNLKFTDYSTDKWVNSPYENTTSTLLYHRSFEPYLADDDIESVERLPEGTMEDFMRECDRIMALMKKPNVFHRTYEDIQENQIYRSYSFHLHVPKVVNGRYKIRHHSTQKVDKKSQSWHSTKYYIIESLKTDFESIMKDAGYTTRKL